MMISRNLFQFKTAVNRTQQEFVTSPIRSIHRNPIFFENKPIEKVSIASKNVEEKKQAMPGALETPSPIRAVMCQPTQLDKWLLVWYKEYKSIDDVPRLIAIDRMYKIHSKSRIMIANTLMVSFLLAFAWVIWSGKKSVGTGETFQQKIINHNTKLREEYLESLKKESKSK